MNKEDYLKERNALVEKEKRTATGGDLTLKDAERRVNEVLMKWKRAEIKTGHDDDGYYIPSMHFFQAKEYMERSEIFKMIQRMPKGGALHLHDIASGSVRWLIKNATYDINCYMMVDKRGLILFHFFSSPPSHPDGTWVPVVQARAESTDPEEFDNNLYSQLTLIVPDPHTAYPRQQDVWRRFTEVFESLAGLCLYAPVFKAFMYRCIEEFWADGCQFIETRVILFPVYELDGSTHDMDWIVRTFVDISDQFVKDHQDFVGIRIIYNSLRTDASRELIKTAILDSLKYREMYPDHFAGYDLSAEENTGRPLVDFIDELLYPTQHGLDLPYFFHAGETFWKDSSADLNTFDAVLLNTRRIGHGYSLNKHPALMDLVRQRKIPIEISPISNQVLMLVKDLRNHPGAVFLSEGHPVVISSDDPGVWGASGLSYDLYEALMGLGGEWADLATLKQLAINSIEYSSLTPVAKEKALKIWQTKWDEFINKELTLSCDQEQEQ